MDKMDSEERFNQHDQRKNDKRSNFDIDMARIIHSASFRRLQGKTQILGLGDSDFYRTRLTHSIEVAQIANGIVRYLSDEKNSEFIDYLPGTALITAISLAHDIGHPPFGHGGEIALNFLMRKHGGFEGNAQTLRLVNLLEPRSELGGINLTRRTLLGLIKYPAKYSTVNCETDIARERAGLCFADIKLDDWKPPKCYYDEEQYLVEWMLSPFIPADRAKFSRVKLPDLDSHAHNKTCHKSLDTSIMDIADDIAYGVHDLEDAIAMHLISREDWERESTECFEKIDPAWLCENLLTKEEREYVKGQTPQQVFSDKLFGSSWKRKDAVGAMVHALVTHVKCVKSPDFSDPLLHYNAILSKNEPAYKLLQCLKELVIKKVIENVNVQTLEYRGLRIVAELYQAFLTNPNRLLPEKTRDKIKERGIPLERGISDHISGMTDEYATKMYERLFVPREGSIYQLL